MGSTPSTVADRVALLECADDGTPVRLDWDHRAWRVTDRPTPLEDALAPVLTHPLPITGWRFQGSAAGGHRVLVFDVLRLDDAWCVVRTYD